MLKWYVTPHRRTPQSRDEILADWHDGKPYRVYLSGGVLISGNETTKLKMAGVTHIHFIWQLEDLRMQDYLFELK
jgi:hypothetical protein